MNLGRPSGTWALGGHFSRHCAALRAGLRSAAPPALEADGQDRAKNL